MPHLGGWDPKKRTRHPLEVARPRPSTVSFNDNILTTEFPAYSTETTDHVNGNRSDPVTSLTSRFRSLFAGRTAAHGTSVAADARTVRKRVTNVEYERHLNSSGGDEAWSLGLCPLRDNN